MKPIRLSFYHLKSRLTVVYTAAFLVVLFIFMGVIYLSVRQSILTSVDQSLNTQIDSIRTTIETTAHASVKNYFRARAWASIDVVEACYNKYLAGEMTEEEAKRQATAYISSQRIGKNGYAALISDEAKVVYHPFEKEGTDISGYPFVLEALKQKESYIEYEWKNPQDQKLKPKSLYSVKFEPWHWCVAITGYNDELGTLVSVSDFEDNILAIPFGETGYPVVIGFDGTLLIHPQYKGVNMINRADSMGEVTRKAVTEREGKTYYYWKNPDESHYRKKITIYSEVKGFDMIVAATAYESEFMKPLMALQYIFLCITAVTLLIVIALTKYISHGITKPVVSLKNWMEEAKAGNLEVRATITSEDEIGEIGCYFNNLMDTIEQKQRDLNNQLIVNQEIAEELQASLVDLKEAQERLVQEERYASMGSLLIRVAHHLNTPLGSAITGLSFLESETQKLQTAINEKKLHQSMLTKYLEQVVDSVAILSRSLILASNKIESFRAILMKPALLVESEVLLDAFLEEVYLGVWQAKLPSNIQVQLLTQPDLKLVTYPELLLLVLNNLTENSIQHGISEGQNGLIKIEFSSKEEGVEIVYSDNGKGINPKDNQRLFEPFYSPDNSFMATGLGLYAIYNTIVQIFGGTIKYVGDENSGVRYIMFIPSLRGQ